MKNIVGFKEEESLYNIPFTEEPFYFRSIDFVSLYFSLTESMRSCFSKKALLEGKFMIVTSIVHSAISLDERIKSCVY